MADTKHRWSGWQVVGAVPPDARVKRKGTILQRFCRNGHGTRKQCAKHRQPGCCDVIDTRTVRGSIDVWFSRERKRNAGLMTDGALNRLVEREHVS